MTARRITICGGFGGVNIGDEAIAQTMERQIASLAPQADIGLLCCFVKRVVLSETQYAPKGVDVISRQDWAMIWRWLGQGPLVIGGGQMLNGVARPKGLMFLLLIALIALIRRQQVMLLGVGTHAIDRFALSRWCCRRLAGLAAVLRVRDLQSKAALVACGVPEAKVEVTADVVFSNVLPQPEVAASETKAPLCFAIHQNPREPHYMPATYAGFVTRIAEGYPEHPVALVCHDVRPGYDLDFAQEVAGHLAQADAGASQVDILCPPDLEAALALYHTAPLVVSSRMHPLILALLVGARVLPVEGSPKVADLTQLLGAGAPITLSDPEQAKDKILHGVPEALQAAAQSNFEGLEAVFPDAFS